MSTLLKTHQISRLITCEQLGQHAERMSRKWPNSFSSGAKVFANYLIEEDARGVLKRAGTAQREAEPAIMVALSTAKEMQTSWTSEEHNAQKELAMLSKDAHLFGLMTSVMAAGAVIGAAGMSALHNGPSRVFAAFFLALSAMGAAFSGNITYKLVRAISDIKSYIGEGRRFVEAAGDLMLQKFTQHDEQAGE